MREIKFRAWDKNEERMIYSGTEQNDYPFVWQLHNTGIDVLEHDGTDWNRLKDLVFEQYTGLKDKNGKEIYEGDVLERFPYWGWYVVYENGCFRMSWINEVQRVNWKHYSLNQEMTEDWEVIGNIHENPELLEAPNETL